MGVSPSPPVGHKERRKCVWGVCGPGGRPNKVTSEATLMSLSRSEPDGGGTPSLLGPGLQSLRLQVGPALGLLGGLPQQCSPSLQSCLLSWRTKPLRHWHS